MVKTTESTPLWEGNFLEVSTGTIRTGFGLIRTINKDSKTTYRHDGVDYNASSSTDVIATNSGKVTYVGEYALTGKLIVIDHGLGLKTWYANLSSINVKTGDTVNKGDVIGHPGTTGFTNTSNVHAGMSVFEVPVCPYPLWETGIVIAEK